MADQLQLRGGTTAETLLFTGAQREVTVDTDKKTLVVQDGVTAGGFPIASESLVVDGTFYFNDNTGGGSVANSYLLSPKANTQTPTAYKDGIQLGFTTNNANTGPATANFSGLGVKSLKYAGGIDPLAGDISGRVYLIYDLANNWLEIQRKPGVTNKQLQGITSTVGSNALTVSLPATVLDFRSATLSSGTINQRAITSTISLVVPSGATLGTTNSVISRIVVVAIDNAGTIELAVVNVLGGNNLDETTLINTTAISGASSAANVFYSTTARTGVPFRVVGFVDSTQTTAGLWASSPSEIQGSGGQANIGVYRMVQGAVIPTTSGTAIDITGIPIWAKRVTIIVDGVSTSSAGVPTIRLGTQSGVENTAYKSSITSIGSSSVLTQASATSGFEISTNGLATYLYTGSYVLIKSANNMWTINGSSYLVSTVNQVSAVGNKTLSGLLDRIQLTTTGGTDTFDAGTIMVTYEG
jgi:hypothetical protein